MDVADVELLIRLTARVSATAFLAALILFACGSRGRTRYLRTSIGLLTSFIVSHSVHFGAVTWLAVLTSSENIRQRDGWPVAIGVAAAFYLAAFGVLSTWRLVASGHHIRRPRRAAAHLGVIFIAGIFLNSYVARVGSMPVYWVWATAMVVVVTAYLVQTRTIFEPGGRLANPPAPFHPSSF